MKKKHFNRLLRIIFKFIFVLIVFFLLGISFFSYNFYSAGQKIFSGNKQISIVKQFKELIFNPVTSLKGEDSGRINILFLGKGGSGHNGGSLTDTIIIASINSQEKEIALLSIPRDLYVHVPNTNINTKINAVKSIGDSKQSKNGINLLKKVTKKISGLDIHYYIELDFNGFIKTIDNLEGIDVYLENDINDPTYPNFNNGYDPFYISKGWQHLDGQTALKVARSRHSKMGDFDRIQRQQAIIKASKQKIFEKYSKYDVISLQNILNSLSNNMTTDIQLKEFPRFYSLIKEIKNHKITANVLDTRKYLNRTYVGMGYTLQAKDENYKQIKNFSANIFDLKISPEKKELIKKENARIEIRNGTGTLDLANQISRDLEKLGLQIINSTNISSSDFSGVKIIDNSDSLKPITLELLKEKFGEIIIKQKDKNDDDIDFYIILENNF